MLPIMIYKVQGISMEPNYLPGQIVLVTKIFTPRIGDVVVAKDPRNDRKILKRIKNKSGNDFFLIGDNEVVSTDSNLFGYIQRENIIGKVIKKF